MRNPETLLRYAFQIIGRQLPGRYDVLQKFLKDAPYPVVEEFHRLIQTFEEEVEHAKKLGRMGGHPWAGR